MRKILFLLSLIPLMGCSHKKASHTFEKEDTTFYEGDIQDLRCKQDDITYDEYMRRIHAYLDSMTKEGEYVLVRGSDRNYDTIIDHVRYKYITDE